MKKLDVYLSNLMVGNVKLHNLHWNVIGLQFKAVHEYLESLYDDFFEKFDEVAEYQKRNGVFPKASLKAYLENSSIEELESESVDCKQADSAALELLKQQRDLALEIREEASDFALSNLLEDHIEGYSKQIWFMESMLA